MIELLVIIVIMRLFLAFMKIFNCNHASACITFIHGEALSLKEMGGERTAITLNNQTDSANLL